MGACCGKKDGAVEGESEHSEARRMEKEEMEQLRQQVAALKQQLDQRDGRDQRDRRGSVQQPAVVKALPPADDPGSTDLDSGFAFEEKEYIYVRPAGASSACITLLLLGETGSGKSTLVNAMVNFALGVKYNDPVRYRVVREAQPLTAEQAAKSQTK
eukprot:Sspe_Gene.31671::Locus_15596_Transcript_1_1_Confidence_1.000_Length_1169::g.31671::m.31671